MKKIKRLKVVLHKASGLQVSDRLAQKIADDLQEKLNEKAKQYSFQP